MGDHAIKSQLLLSCVTESKFADDAVLYPPSRNRLEVVASSFVCVARGWDLIVSLIKSEGMVEADSSVLAPISVKGGGNRLGGEISVFG